MSSLKDIMDVDVEPLEAYAYRRSKEAAQRLASQTSSAQAPSIQAPSQSSQTLINTRKEELPTTRRRSNRTSKSSGSPSTTSRDPIDDHRSSSIVKGEGMAFTQSGESSQAGAQMSPQQPSRGGQHAQEIPVKYTPVTGRISKAKKGVPVHTCDICRPVKVG